MLVWKFCGWSMNLRGSANYGLPNNSAATLPFSILAAVLDISILKLISTEDGDIYQVLSTNGDTHLGGDDIDNLLQALVHERFYTD